MHLYFGTIQNGATFVPVHQDSRETEHFVHDCRPSLIVCDASRLDEFRNKYQSNQTSSYALFSFFFESQTIFLDGKILNEQSKFLSSGLLRSTRKRCC